jgi:putative transposase
MSMVRELAERVGITAACDALGLSRASFYRQQQPRRPERSELPRPAPPRALSVVERQQVLGELNSERFADQAPRQVYATILDEGRYRCSVRTMYRVLKENQQVKERRDQLRHPRYAKPELLATGPNQVWSWDITKLLGPAKWVYFYLYVVLDIFSRYVVGWMVAEQESKELAGRLVEESCFKQGIQPGQLTLHADRGSVMKSLAQLLDDLGVAKTHSRPHVSNDNPFSESHFKTLKYRPSFPDRFGSLQDARGLLGELLDWYNNEHRHTGIGLLTPATVHYGLAEQVRAARQEVLRAAYLAHPERFVRGVPEPPVLPPAVWINPPEPKTTRQDAPGSLPKESDDVQVPPVFSTYGQVAGSAPLAAAPALAPSTLITLSPVSQNH